MSVAPPADHAPADLQDSEWDVIVIGAGSTGENVADRAHRGGLSAVVVEAELVGGDCSYWACMPSKALLRPGEVLAAARAVDGAAQAVTGSLDVEQVLARRDSFTSHWSDGGQVSWLDDAGLSLVRGHGRLVGERRVEVTGRGGARVALTARQAVVICTGSRARIPEVAGLAEAEPWTSREATSARHVPARLAVIGGGVVATEMATAFRSLGAEVSVLARDDRLLPAMEPEVSRRVRVALERAGVRVRTSVTVTQVRRDGPVRVTLADGSAVEADEVLVAAGRQPRTEDVGLDTVGLTPGEVLEVDDSLRVTGVADGWLYAAGDCNGRALLTHMGKYQARACGDVIGARAAGSVPSRGMPPPWSAHAATADHRSVPQVTFTDPQAASVGLTEAAAREAGFEVRCAEYEIGQVAGASLLADGYDGWAKLVVDAHRRVIIGAHFVGPQVGDLLHAATIAVVAQVPLERLWHAVPSYPTTSEVWLRLLEAYGL
jgi:dihydrolipoamide dehydrogenase